MVAFGWKKVRWDLFGATVRYAAFTQAITMIERKIEMYFCSSPREKKRKQPPASACIKKLDGFPYAAARSSCSCSSRVDYLSGTPVTVFGNCAESSAWKKQLGGVARSGIRRSISFARENSTLPAVIFGTRYLADATWLVANCG